MNENVSVSRLIAEAVRACKSFAVCSKKFFDYEKTGSWRGWENWLTVDIVRRLKSKYVKPFYGYSDLGNTTTTKQEMDIYVRGSTQMVVEIKVNYIDEEEIPKFQKNKRVLPVRITDDLKKIKLIGEDPYFLLLVATVLESPESLRSYKEIVDRDLKKRFNRKEWTWEWYNCSDKKEGGYILLLVIKDEGRLPSEKTVSKVK